MAWDDMPRAHETATATGVSISATEDVRPLPAAPTVSAALLELERYDDLGGIGAGGMGEVRRVYDRLLERTLAMKVLAWKRVGTSEASEQFLHEARVTSNLQHPGIVAVHDVGVLPDGRPWYTMQEVRGETFGSKVRALHQQDEEAAGSGLVRLVQLLLRVCDALSFAHERGVIHCDLKPSNIMVGRFGEVQVMDWGLSRSSSRCTAQRKIAGTPSYMSPEQARGEKLAPSSDVYSMGAVLYETMTGSTPYTGSSRKIIIDLLEGRLRPLSEEPAHVLRPTALCAITDKAMARQSAARYADAGALARALEQWLDRRWHHQRAMLIVERADAARPTIIDLKRRACDLRDISATLLEDVQPYDVLERKLPAWRLLEQAAEYEREAAVQEVAWQQMMRSALNEVPNLAAAHKRLAAHYRARLQAAEAARDRETAARAEALLRIHDRGKYAAYLRGDSTLTLLTEPARACLTLHRYQCVDRQLRLQQLHEFGPTPVIDHTLPAGSYLIVVRASGHHEVRYPVYMPRGGAWTGVRPGTSQPTAIKLPKLGTLAADDVYVPAGWFTAGGDPNGMEPLPLRRIWLDSFVIRRHPVTCGEYLAYLNALVAAGDDEEALQRSPKEPMGRSQNGAAESIWPRNGDGHYQLDPACDDARQAHWPVSLIDWHDACAYTRWYAQQSSLAWRLPSELEWEKAARGVDGRLLPWGDYFEPTFACVIDSHDGVLRAHPVTAYPRDESPYGVRGCAGNVRDWCRERWTRGGPKIVDGRLAHQALEEDDERLRSVDGLRSVRGGAWTSVAAYGRPASRLAAKPADRFRGQGFRLVRSIDDGGQS